MGSKYSTHISNSNIGAFGQGDNVNVSGSLTLGGPILLTQEQHKAAIKRAQNALNEDQDALARIDDRLHEALGQFLRLAREIQVEQRSLAEVQSSMKATLEEVWAQQAARGMAPRALPRTLEVVGAIAQHPAAAEVVKKLLGE
ncbi:hypothetical protein [Sorangium sp. So ce1099]|uniref:hypothetical protein n=1 Tax=Sorangium sp. So ce1099 TaxID=3133331 RepID=UPI003F625B6F